MASILPPQPTGVPPNHAYWNDWYNKLRAVINGIATSIKWINLDFSGSKIEDIVSREHNKLQSMQGGTTNEYYHLTNAQHSDIIGLANPNITGKAIDMIVTPKAPLATEDAGTLTLQAQAAVGSTHSGGGVNIYAGNGGASAGTIGGGVQFQAGQGSAFGGNVSFGAGDATDTSGTGGAFSLTAGNAYGVGGIAGDATLRAGTAPSGTNGNAKLVTPNGFDGVIVTDDNVNTLIGLYGVTPTAQHTTTSASATFVVNAGTAINTASTFDGYTIAKVVKALRDVGILA